MSNLSLYNENLIYKKAKEFRVLFPDSDLILSLFNGTKWTRYEFLSGNLLKPITESVFDIASLTKIFTSILTLQLVKYQKLKLNSLIHNIIPTLKDFKHLQLVQLLNHSSHLDLIQKFSTQVDYSRTDFEEILFNPTNLSCKRDISRFTYSDLNYIYLAKIVEKIADQDLENLIFDLNRDYNLNLTFNPLFKQNIDLDSIVATSKINPKGQVYDFKALKLGGIAGHAGLFAKLEDLEKCAFNWIFNDWHFGSELLSQAFYSDVTGKDSETFGLVFRNGRLSSLPNHSGFTGPSMVINPKKQTALVHLNNYTYPEFNESKRQIFKKWNQQICSLLPV